MRAGCLRIRKSKKAAKSNIFCINRLTEAMREEKKTDRQVGRRKRVIVAAIAMWDTKICV
ncbi:hypothetical protein T12_8255 [Trichinella patagoniensis]|uniref:Uncharacterized protein n=1 Tax=Trichinella patagoniensis TaxID=990121 RepID=A0A0V0Z150_9BILA|nr:hypothetical protein T12_13315 [Trichinella patagoniensis]KRY06176.1 hypothetical protein T12_8255 [Trichinella patagoniensis]